MYICLRLGGKARGPPAEPDIAQNASALCWSAEWEIVVLARHQRTIADVGLEGFDDALPTASTAESVAYLFGYRSNVQTLNVVDDHMSAALALAVSSRGSVDLEEALRRSWSDIGTDRAGGARISDLIGDTGRVVGLL